MRAFVRRRSVQKSTFLSIECVSSLCKSTASLAGPQSTVALSADNNLFASTITSISHRLSVVCHSHWFQFIFLFTANSSAFSTHKQNVNNWTYTQNAFSFLLHSQHERIRRPNAADDNWRILKINIQFSFVSQSKHQKLSDYDEDDDNDCDQNKTKKPIYIQTIRAWNIWLRFESFVGFDWCPPRNFKRKRPKAERSIINSGQIRRRAHTREPKPMNDAL